MIEYNQLNNLYNPFARNENFPVDADSLFESYQEALDYARGGSRGDDYTTTAYLGQVISVVEPNESGETTVQVYKIVVEIPESGETPEVWGLTLIGEGTGEGKVKDVEFNDVSFFDEETGIANFKSDEIGVEEDEETGKEKLRVLKIRNEEIEIQ